MAPIIRTLANAATALEINGAASDPRLVKLVTEMRNVLETETGTRYPETGLPYLIKRL